MLPAATSPFAALARFHAASGARVAMRAAVPLAGAITVAIGLTPNPYGSLRAIVAEAAAPHASNAFVAATLALAFGMAGWAAPRVASGAAGWMLSLPSGGATRRRALALGIATGEAPLAIAVAVFSVIGGLRIERVAVLAPLLFGAAYTVLPHRRASAAPLAAAGAIAAFSSVLLGCALVVAADLLAGDERRAPSRRRREAGATA